MVNLVTTVSRVATLNNGHTIWMDAVNPHLNVGDIVNTQWGARTVEKVELVRETFDPFDQWDNHCQ
jgi:hypothetical protein